jgi:hypothetical protein
MCKLSRMKGNVAMMMWEQIDANCGVESRA